MFSSLWPTLATALSKASSHRGGVVRVTLGGVKAVDQSQDVDRVEHQLSKLRNGHCAVLLRTAETPVVHKNPSEAERKESDRLESLRRSQFETAVRWCHSDVSLWEFRRSNPLTLRHSEEGPFIKALGKVGHVEVSSCQESSWLGEDLLNSDITPKLQNR